MDSELEYFKWLYLEYEKKGDSDSALLFAKNILEEIARQDPNTLESKILEIESLSDKKLELLAVELGDSKYYDVLKIQRDTVRDRLRAGISESLKQIDFSQETRSKLENVLELTKARVSEGSLTTREKGVLVLAFVGSQNNRNEAYEDSVKDIISEKKKESAEYLQKVAESHNGRYAGPEKVQLFLSQLENSNVASVHFMS